MATAKQIAWRKKFAAMAKAGTLKKVRKANPAKKTKSIKRPSQITKTAPTKRLVKRRTIQKRDPKPGYFPNPSSKTKVYDKLPYSIKPVGGPGPVGHARTKEEAIRIAQAFANFYRIDFSIGKKK